MGRPQKPIVPAKGSTRNAASRGCMMVFFGVFGVAGLATLYITCLYPIGMALASHKWEPTDCLVLSSEVRASRGSDGDTYRIAISYRYHYHGREYVSDRYTFSKMASSGFKGKKRVVDQFPIESQQICYANPSSPQDAVLERGPTKDAWWGLFSLPFIGVGSLAFFGGRLTGNQKRIRSPRKGGGAALLRPESAAPGMPVELKPSTRRSTQLLITLGVALFWNGIVSVFLWQVKHGFDEKSPQWGLTLFMIPFVLVGLFLIVATFYQALALANPTLRITVGTAVVRVGDEVTFNWEFTGQSRRIRSLKITIEAKETATYTRGTNTTTDTNVLFSHVIAQLSDVASIRSGTGKARIPRYAMHSFSTGHNELIWQLRFHGEIPRFPDIKDDFTVEVLPLLPSPRS